MDEKIFNNRIIRIDQPLEYFSDIDSETAEKLRENFKTELKTLHFVEIGDISALQNFMSQNTFTIYLGYSKTKFGSERAFAQRALTLASNAAIKGGADCISVYSIIFRYQSLIEATEDTQKLLELSEEILSTFCRLVGWEVYKKSQTPVLLPVLRYIHSNLNKKITLFQLAEKMNMNANYLSRLFKSEMKENFSDYVNRVKIDQAKNLMATTEMSLLQISNHLAFSSQSYFNNVFKNITGTTPKDYLMTVKNL